MARKITVRKKPADEEKAADNFHVLTFGGKFRLSSLRFNISPRYTLTPGWLGSATQAAQPTCRPLQCEFNTSFLLFCCSEPRALVNYDDCADIAS